MMKNRTRASLIVAGRLVFGLAVLGGIDSEVAGQCDYVVSEIIEAPACGDPVVFTGNALADNGHVGGTFTCFILPQAATWDGVNGLTPLPFLAGFNEARVHGLNSIDEVVGSQFSTTLDWRAVIWQNGVPSRLPDWPGSNTSVATAINRDGWISGAWGDTIFGPGNAAIIWKPDGSMVNVHADLVGSNSRAMDINDFGQVTGWFGSSANPQTFIWDNGQVIELPFIPGGTTLKGLSINNQGHIVGWGKKIDEVTMTEVIRAFFWDGVTTIDLGTLPGFDRSVALDLNDVGQIVGGSFQPGQHAFLWRDGVMIDLHDFLPASFDGVDTGATAINRYGEILVTGGGVGVILSPIGSGPGDIDNNCAVNIDDLLMLLGEWGESISVADINLDGVVNVHDLLALLADWG